MARKQHSIEVVLLIERTPLILEGDLEFSENEGGFSSMTIEVGQQELDVAIAKWAGVYPEINRGGNVYGGMCMGPKVRITIEEID